MSKYPENSGDSIREQLDGKFDKLRIITATCGLNEKDVRDDIAGSMEEANNLTKPMDSLDDSYRWWADWWYKFLMEWVCICFIKYADKTRTLYANALYADYGKMRNLWLSDFEPLWVVGCDIARLTRMDLMTKSMTRFISNKAESYDNNNKQESIWNWVSGFDNIALEILDFFKRKQRKVFESSLEWLKDYDNDSISDKLRLFMSN